ncbi:GAF domain-containing sensor histidine kinase [Candidatus Magnetomonas plexicatena]|uniref:GAF domain-containing sensor histidine kinase n=1 Tax=Candidatus Magnetomonas plexicatena TaxID=2552947 RepID=UPI004032F555
MNCPECGHTHELQKYRLGTEVYCNCGKAMIEVQNQKKEYHGRRKSDQKLHLKDMELQGLIETSHIIHSSTRDLKKLLLMIVKVTNAMMAVEGTSIVLVEPGTKELVFHSVCGNKSTKLINFRIKWAEGIVGKCIVNEKPIIVNNVIMDANFCSSADDTSGFITRSTLCVPLMVEDKCLGALQMVNKKNPGGFDDYDKLLSTSISSQVAVAMHNFQLIEESLQAERMASIGQAITGISHCVKNMLNGLKGGLYILNSEIKKLDATSGLKGYNMLEKNISRLTDLVNDMLTYSKDRHPEYTSANVNDIAESIVHLMEGKAQELGLKIVFQPGDRMQDIRIDQKGIYRSVLNLVSNALEASAHKKDATVEITTKDCGKEILIGIKDEGCGMDKKTLENIFKPFFSTKGSKGTGLGLSVTQKIVSENGGRIEVLSEIGKGSTFNIYLPNRTV